MNLAVISAASVRNLAYEGLVDRLPTSAGGAQRRTTMRSTSAPDNMLDLNVNATRGADASHGCGSWFLDTSEIGHD